MRTFNLFIPTYNAGDRWIEVLQSIQRQDCQARNIVVLDSGSTDETVRLSIEAGFKVVTIEKEHFDHGGTRDYGIQLFPDADVYVFMTHDAILHDVQAFSMLLSAFDRTDVGIAYGRQLPHRNAGVLGSHARLFNYPEQSRLKSMADIPELGIKTISCSNSFAAYRKEAYEQAGGFPRRIILGEDVVIAGKMFLKGWTMAYSAAAQVRHSHDYSVKEEFKRYFDIGVFHADTPFIFDHFGKADSEGLRYVKSEFRYLLKRKPTVIFKALLSNFAKWLGYKAGLRYRRLPKRWIRQITMQPGYWKVLQNFHKFPPEKR